MLVIAARGRSGFHEQLAAVQIAVDDQGLQRRLVGDGLVLRGSGRPDQAGRYRRIVQQPGQLRAVRGDVILRLNGGIRAVIVGRGRKDDLCRAAGNLCRAEMKRGGRGIELGFEIVRKGLERAVGEAAVRIGELSYILLEGFVEDRMKVDIVKVDGQGRGTVVVEDLTAVDHRVADAEIEDAGLAVAVAALDGGDVRMAILVDVHLHHRLIHPNVVEVPLLAQDGYDSHACFGVLHLEQWRAGVRTGAVHRDTIEIQAEIRKVHRKVLQLHADAEALLRLLLGGPDHVVMKPRAVEQDGCREGEEKKENRRSRVEPRNDSHEAAVAARRNGFGMIGKTHHHNLLSNSDQRIDSVLISLFREDRLVKNSSKCLAYADEVLRCLHAGDGVEILSYVHADGTDRGGVAEAAAHVIRI